MCWAATCYLHVRWWKEAITMEICQVKNCEKKIICSVQVSLDSTDSWINNTYKRKRFCTQEGKLQTGLREILKPGETEPQHRREQTGDRSNRHEASLNSVPAAEATSAGVQLPGHVIPVKCSAGRQACIFFFQIQLYVSDHPWNTHTELQKIKVWQHHTESSALSCSPKEGSDTAAPFLMDGYLTLNTSNIRDPNTSVPIIFQHFTILIHTKFS